MACAPNVAHQFNLACLQPPKDGGLSINTILASGNGGCSNTENSSTTTTTTQVQNISISNGHLSISKDKDVSCNGLASAFHKDKDKDVSCNGLASALHKDKDKDKDVSCNGHVNGGHKDKEVSANAHLDILVKEKEKDAASNGHVIKDKEVASKVLIIGATGFIGRYVAEASVKSGHTTYALVRPTTSKQKLVQELSEFGIQILHGCVEDYNSLVKAIREVNIVISTIGGPQILSQLRIIDAIKEVGATVKRFLPSEFGHDVDHADPEEPALAFYKEKRKIRRALEEAMIPYTYICCNSIAGWPYYYHTHPTEIPPPSDRFEIYGDGNVKAYFVAGEDIGEYTMQAVDDPRTLNKSLHFRPPRNFLTLNEMASIWEAKIQKTLPRVTITEEDLLTIAKANIMPSSIVAALTHDIFINGCQYKFTLQEPHDVEACDLYPAINYTTIEDFFSQYL